MARYVARICPRCRDDFGVVVNQTPHSNGERPINAYCTLCGYRLDGWRLIVSRKRPALIYGARVPKVFRWLVAGSVALAPSVAESWPWSCDHQTRIQLYRRSTGAVFAVAIG